MIGNKESVETNVSGDSQSHGVAVINQSSTQVTFVESEFNGGMVLESTGKGLSIESLENIPSLQKTERSIVTLTSEAVGVSTLATGTEFQGYVDKIYRIDDGVDEETGVVRVQHQAEVLVFKGMNSETGKPVFDRMSFRSTMLVNEFIRFVKIGVLSVGSFDTPISFVFLGREKCSSNPKFSYGKWKIWMVRAVN